MIRASLFVLLSVLCGAAGNLCLKEGMNGVGELASAAPLALVEFFADAALNPWIWLGILFEIAYSLLWLAVLSWSEVSWAVPMNAVEYVLVGVAASFFLGEPVGALRWTGIALVSVGLYLLAGSWKPGTQAA